jgi:hypothetical protein
MSLDDQDTILEGLTVLPYERAFTPPPRPVEPDDLPHDTRRVVGCESAKWGAGKFKDNAVGITVLFPSWIPPEIKAQAEKKIPLAAAEIVNEYLSRRFVGTED